MALSAVDALARENARLRREAEQRVLEIERRQRVAEGLRDLLAIVNSGHKLDEILDAVLAQSSRLLGADAAWCTCATITSLTSCKHVPRWGWTARALPRKCASAHQQPASR